MTIMIIKNFKVDFWILFNRKHFEHLRALCVYIVSNWHSWCKYFVYWFSRAGEIFIASCIVAPTSCCYCFTLRYRYYSCYAFCYCCSLMLIVVVELLFWRSIYSPVDLLTVKCVQYVFLMTFSRKSFFLISVIILVSYLIFCFLRVVTCINSCINK